ncbi:glycosyltransferase family 92 protein-like isoform X1 [Iris pallida]|uniref:Glycosyltransferase family 92 protein n=1 Tax=Iris pallida TaxID=29817 RepID=A0AAX6GG83_IRIPA|nr:glycosyltransferase family 92 protein-like isoform X1 [Iris pallida]
MMRGRKAEESMKDHRRKRTTSSSSSSSSSFFFFFLLCILLFSIVALSTFRLFGVSFRPVLISTWQTPSMNAVGSDDLFPRRILPSRTPPGSPSTRIQEAVSFPDFLLLFVERPPSSRAPAFANSELLCLYFPPSSPSSPNPKLPPVSSSDRDSFVRCPPAPRNFLVSLSLSPSLSLRPVPALTWDRLAYSAVLDTQDNTTVVFAKGLNLRPARLSDPNRYECVFGWQFGNPKYLLTSEAVSAAQEIFRCITPLSVLHRANVRPPPLVSIRTRGPRSFTLPSVARPEIISLPSGGRRKENKMCICTMVRNQARFLREWVAYHSRIGVERWFIYDNNSDDNIEEVVDSMSSVVNLHEWPWIKTQEAGFAHCALRAKGSCEWVGFIDVDEFLHFPTNVTLQDVLRNYSSQPWVGELRTPCHSFGPSGKKEVPTEGVMLGYTCRMAAPERHKSIVRPEALNHSLINIVHHFDLAEGKSYVNMDRYMVINHYKYQVWEVFKEKFYRRVATYVTDWKDEENVGSKDRAPGLGTKPVEPPDWSMRFCEVNDTGLRDWVLSEFVDRSSGGGLSW